MLELLVMSLLIERKKEEEKRKNVEKRRQNRQISLHTRETGVFSDLSEKKMKKNAWQRKGREFQMTGPMSWKDLSPYVLLTILGTRMIRVFLAERRE